MTDVPPTANTSPAPDQLHQEDFEATLPRWVPILIGAVIWVYSAQGGVWGTAFLVWAILCSTIDNAVRPFLIKRGADLPLLLIFGGVIGGLVSFGVIGLFVGPVVLAVAYMLLQEWMEEPAEAEVAPP